MCYGSVDLKYVLQDIEVRARQLPAADRTENPAAPIRLPGLVARMRDAALAVMKKDRAHV